MTNQLNGRVAIITGGASGMGKATALRFLDEGAAVVIGDLNVAAGEALVTELGDRGARVRFVRTDVSVEPDIESLVATATDAFGRLDIMFNNAGIGGAFGPITEIELDDWNQTFAILTASVFLGIKHASRVMIAQGDGGSIINTASVAGLGGGGGPQAYSAAKAAVVNLSQTTALELAEYRIRVNAICPGLIHTPLVHAGNPAAIEQAAATAARLQPWPDPGTGDDIAGAALWLAGNDSSFYTGQALTVDGGISAAGTRLFGELGNTKNLDKNVGIAYGTTGEKARTRRLPASGE